MAADLSGPQANLDRRRTLWSASAVLAFSTGFGGICLSMAFQALMYNLVPEPREAPGLMTV